MIGESHELRLEASNVDPDNLASSLLLTSNAAGPHSVAVDRLFGGSEKNNDRPASRSSEHGQKKWSAKPASGRWSIRPASKNKSARLASRSSERGQKRWSARPARKRWSTSEACRSTTR